MAGDDGSSDSGSGTTEHDDDPLIGRSLANRYQILDKLGEGGMGTVYVAEHSSLEKKVALKVLHGEFARHRDFVERFLREGRAASKIGHEHIIDVTDFGQTPDGYVFFTMELLEGSDLNEELHAVGNGAPLPWARARSIFLQVCEALAAAHKHGIVHRDLKPENIFLTERYGKSDFVKLLDFGLAKMIDQSKRLTKTGELFGTPQYMSPEQARGDDVDGRADVYAMGCILYEMVTGAVPFNSENFMTTLTKQLVDPPPPMDKDALAVCGAPAEIEPIVLAALEKSREARTQTIAQFAEAVRALPEGEVEPATPKAIREDEWTGTARLFPTDPPPLPSAMKPRWGFVKALFLALAIAAIGYLIGLREGSMRKSHPVEPGKRRVLPPPRRAPAFVTITIDSVPTGADLYDQDGARIGQTPYEFEAPADPEMEQMTLKKSGFVDRQIDVTFTANRTYRPELTPLPPMDARKKKHRKPGRRPR